MVSKTKWLGATAMCLTSIAVAMGSGVAQAAGPPITCPVGEHPQVSFLRDGTRGQELVFICVPNAKP
jgi:hypothetical protein